MSAYINNSNFFNGSKRRTSDLTTFLASKMIAMSCWVLQGILWARWVHRQMRYILFNYMVPLTEESIIWLLSFLLAILACQWWDLLSRCLAKGERLYLFKGYYYKMSAVTSHRDCGYWPCSTTDHAILCNYSLLRACLTILPL